MSFIVLPSSSDRGIPHTDLISPSAQVISAASLPSTITEGTLYAEFSGQQTGDNFGTIMTHGASSGNNYIILQMNKTNSDPLLWRVRCNTATNRPTLDTNQGAVIGGRINRAAMAYRNGYWRFYLNGVQVMQSAHASFPTSFNGGIGVGRNIATGAAYSGTIRRFQWYSYAMNDQELTSLTGYADIAAPLTITYSSLRNFGIWVGDSNANGASPLAGAPAYINTGRIFKLTKPMAYEVYSDPSGDGTSVFNAYITSTNNNLANCGRAIDTIASSRNGDWVAIPCAEGGTTLSTSWDATIAGTDQTSTSDRIICAMQASQWAQRYGNLRFLVLQVGANDAVGAVSASTYTQAQNDFITSVRRLYPEMPIVIVSLHQWHSGTGATESNWNGIQTAQNAASGTHIYTVNASDLAGIVGNEIHLSQSSQLTVGDRIAAALLGGAL